MSVEAILSHGCTTGGKPEQSEVRGVVSNRLCTNSRSRCAVRPQIFDGNHFNKVNDATATVSAAAAAAAAAARRGGEKIGFCT